MRNDSYHHPIEDLHLINYFNDTFEKSRARLSEYGRILDTGWKYRSYSGQNKSKGFVPDKEFGLTSRWKKKDRRGLSRVD